MVEVVALANNKYVLKLRMIEFTLMHDHCQFVLILFYAGVGTGSPVCVGPGSQVLYPGDELLLNRPLSSL